MTKVPKLTPKNPATKARPRKAKSKQVATATPRVPRSHVRKIRKINLAVVTAKTAVRKTRKQGRLKLPAMVRKKRRTLMRVDTTMVMVTAIHINAHSIFADPVELTVSIPVTQWTWSIQPVLRAIPVRVKPAKF